MPKLESYESQDAIPEALREFYIEKNGRWVPDAPELYAAGQNALDGERRQRAEATKRAEALEAKLREAEAKLQEAVAAPTPRGEEAKGEAAAEIVRLKREYDSRLSAFEAELKAHKEKAQTAERALQEKSIQDVLRAAALDAGVPKESIEDLISLPKFRQPWRMTETGDPAPYDGDVPRYDPDATGRPMTAKSYVAEYLKENKHWLPQPTGGGAHGSLSGRQAGGVITVSREQMRDHAQYNAVQQQAQKTGATIQVTD